MATAHWPAKAAAVGSALKTPVAIIVAAQCVATMIGGGRQPAASLPAAWLLFSAILRARAFQPGGNVAGSRFAVVFGLARNDEPRRCSGVRVLQ